MPDCLSVCLSVTSESTFSVFSTEQAPSEQQHERKRERKVEEKQQQEEEILDQSPQNEKEEVEEETPGRRRTVDGLVVCPREQLKEELKAAKQRRRDMRIQEGVAVGTASSSSSKGHGM